MAVSHNSTFFPVERFAALDTPFYYYDLRLLRQTAAAALEAADGAPFCIHYALKACAATEVLHLLAQSGLGADCVSGGEIRAALDAGIPAERIVFAGVAKADWEIRYALEQGIFCFNAESVPELEVIDSIAGEMHCRARVALRINPNVDAHTHRLITTGRQENKFGIGWNEAEDAVRLCRSLKHLDFAGLHFHIGSQITTLEPYRELCGRINTLQERLAAQGVQADYLNVGGGLGIDYEDPDGCPIPDFRAYFDVFRQHLRLQPQQTVHFELGRSIVGQCGSLITRVLYVKKGAEKEFVMVDAGMNDLIRPALYGAHHAIRHLSASSGETGVYDVVGPVCESSDVFAESYTLPLTHRGDLLAIRSAGAYGESMASTYNLRRLPGHITSETE